MIRRIAVDPDLVWVHIATQCGTFSRAREKRLPKRLRKAGVPESPPLRSDAQPRGLNPCQCHEGCHGIAVCSVCKGLSPRSQERVAKANTLAAFSVEIARLAQSTHPNACVISIENPRSSLLWHLEEFVALTAESGMMFSTFQACMLGGDRDKWIGILHNSPVLAERLAPFVCDGKHTHKPWGWKTESEGWNTADTAAYPDAMSAVFVGAVKEELLSKGVAPATAKSPPPPMAPAGHGLSAVPPPASPPVNYRGCKRSAAEAAKLEKQLDTKRRATMRAAVGLQATGRRHPQVVPEFHSTLKLSLEVESLQLDAIAWQPGMKGALTAPWALPGVTLPKGAVKISAERLDDVGKWREPSCLRWACLPRQSSSPRRLCRRSTHSTRWPRSMII